MKVRFCCVLLSLGSLAAQVVFEHGPQRVEVKVNGKAFTTLHFGGEANKPFLHPLKSTSGVSVTRGFPLEKIAGEPVDHPHQKGLFVGTERLSGMDFWENDNSYKRPRMGKIVFRDVTKMADGDGSGTLAFQADWISPEGKLVVSQVEELTFFTTPRDARVFDVDIRLTAKADVTFEDHQDAVMGIRLRPAFEEAQGGVAVNAQGFEKEAGVRGKASEWVDWQSTVEKERLGFAIFDHPSNPGSPARWHMRGFGFIAVNPFARKVFDEKAPSAARDLKTGESLRFRYRVVIHGDKFDVPAAYRQFAEVK